MTIVEKIPIILLTGFLGSGKTVLLNALLQRPGLTDSAVIVNEFGEIGLDHLLVATSKEKIVLLDAGCLCCAVLGSLKETLLDLQQRRASGAIPAFRRVLVETTGLADPGPIVQSIVRDSVVSHFYRLGGIVCVVDALHAQAQLAERLEAQRQVAYADRIVVTKTDLSGGNCPGVLRQRLQELNPNSELLIASFGQIEAERLLRNDTDAVNLPWLGKLHAAGDGQSGHGGHGSHGGHDDGGHEHAAGARHDPQIGAESFLFSAAVSWSGLAAWIDAVRRRYGRDLLRCKGIVNIGDRAVLVHGVETAFDTRQMPQWPDSERRSRLVLIGKGLKREELEPLLGLLTGT